MPTGVYIRTRKIRDKLKLRKYIRTKEWGENIAKSLRRGEFRICKCGKKFYAHRYSIKIGQGNFCSIKCVGKYGNRVGWNKGIKMPKLSLARMGDKNPMVIHGIKPEHLRKLQEGAKKYQDSIRVTKEHKLIVKRILEHKREASVKGIFLPQDWFSLKEKYKFTCPCCGKKEPNIKLTIDHILPLSKNGTNTIDNIQPLCLSCNCRKNNRSKTKYETL